MSLTTFSPIVHGARDYGELARLGLDPDDILDFSANSNPYGPHPAVLQAVREAISEATLARYPDRDCLALRAALAVAENLPIDRLLPGNGAAELIQLIALACVAPGSRHLILAPTFGEYARAIQLMGGVIDEHRPLPRADFRFETEQVFEAISRLQPEGVWLCNPNNPTGQQWSAAELNYLRAADPDRRAWWVIDESYRYFTASPTPLSGQAPDQASGDDIHKTWAGGPKVIILRSLTKDFALAGLRLGYIVASVELVGLLRAIQPPWSVNSLAQIAGIAALQKDVLAWRQHSLAELRRQAQELWAGLSRSGFEVLPSAAPYTLVRVGDAAAFRGRLLGHGLLVRDATSFGLPGHIRIAAQRPEANQRLLATIKSHPHIFNHEL